MPASGLTIEPAYLVLQNKQDFYRFHSAIMEPWDGPALVAFTDGRFVGATLDRNGLRPGRYYLTRDNTVSVAADAAAADTALLMPLLLNCQAASSFCV